MSESRLKKPQSGSIRNKTFWINEEDNDWCDRASDHRVRV